MSSTPEMLKNLGNEAFARKDFNKAIDYFTEAINRSQNDDDGNLHVYYSNRSAAFLSLGKGNEALADAKKCIDLRPQWSKGYSRKGSALFKLKRYRDAIDSFRKGLEIDPTNAVMAEALADAEREDRILRGIDDTAGAPRTSRGSGGSGGQARTGGVPTSLQGYLFGSIDAKVNTFQLVLRSFLLVNFVLYLLSMFSPYSSAVYFSSFMKTALVNYFVFLAWHHGVPKLNMQYGMRLIQDPTTHYVFYALIFLGSPPYLIAFVPILLSELVHVSYAATQILKLSRPAIGSVLYARVSPLMARFTGRADWDSIAENNKWAVIQGRVTQMCASAEVSQGMLLLLELIMPTRNFFLTMLFWQFLRVRYMVSNDIKTAFNRLDARIMQLINKPACPSVIRTVYGKIQTFCAGMVKVPDAQQQQGAQGQAPRCTIM